ncbi:uncharacterized protein F4807DRAFT_134273 [Annulohypoxylon truncatum]|uniref:uncharacterized protein n=1 Tax=Annulohypoxylon truncatum TaxID=327061 RepID=UPI002008596F|nr:uncharacterized protein F4807DRAFT_134273 [Annulohypoxylon truncatum]KAI1208796.1 hypothetical protein F4807DRAFT_134273 [Annulohypoxylon truncatum]
MPPDPLSAEARVPMLSPTPSPLPSPSPSPRSSSPRTDATAVVPPWVRPSPQRPASGQNSRRLSTPYSRSAAASDESHAPLGQRLMRGSLTLANKMLKLFYTLTPLQRVLFVLALLAANVLLVLGMVYSHRIFKALGPVAQGWRALPGGWVLVFLMTCLSGFPPMIGYSTCVTVAGFVYGFPGGWPIVAGATVFGSLAAFLTSRTVFAGYVHSLVGADKRFVALGQVLRRDGLLVLAAIRFCPLPFSLSNGFLATISTITPLRFATATAMATPKLLVHVFIGSRLALLAESGDEMSVGDKVVNYLSMLVGSAVGIALSLFIYRRTMARANELAREEAAENGGAGGGGDVDLSYEDLEEGVLGQRPGEADEAALMDDDDISLWETEGLESGYRDEDTEGEGNGNGNGKQNH